MGARIYNLKSGTKGNFLDVPSIQKLEFAGLIKQVGFRNSQQLFLCIIPTNYFWLLARIA